MFAVRNLMSHVTKPSVLRTVCKDYKNNTVSVIQQQCINKTTCYSFGNQIQHQTICQNMQVRLFGSVLKKRKKKMNKHKLKKLRKKLKRKNNQ